MEQYEAKYRYDDGVKSFHQPTVGKYNLSNLVNSKGYLQVLSRPLALSQDDSLIDWSLPYQDAAVI